MLAVLLLVLIGYSTASSATVDTVCGGMHLDNHGRILCNVCINLDHFVSAHTGFQAVASKSVAVGEAVEERSNSAPTGLLVSTANSVVGCCAACNARGADCVAWVTARADNSGMNCWLLSCPNSFRASSDRITGGVALAPEYCGSHYPPSPPPPPGRHVAVVGNGMG